MCKRVTCMINVALYDFGFTIHTFCIHCINEMFINIVHVHKGKIDFKDWGSSLNELTVTTWSSLNGISTWKLREIRVVCVPCKLTTDLNITQTSALLWHQSYDTNFVWYFENKLVAIHNQNSEFKSKSLQHACI